MTAAATLSPAVCALARVAQDPEPAAAALGLKPEQALNLARLAAYLRTLPEDYERFEMGWFYSGSQDDPQQRQKEEQPLGATYGCGTSACAVGHGPAAGVAPLPGEAWAEYGRRAFTDGENQLFVALFSGSWTEQDNSPRGAAARIAYALDAGMPAVDRMAADWKPGDYARYLG